MRLLAILTTFAALAATPSFAGTPQTVMLDVQNMTCPVCPITVKKALEKVPGVTEAKVDFSRKTATVKFDPDQADTTALVDATAAAGYPSTLHK